MIELENTYIYTGKDLAVRDNSCRFCSDGILNPGEALMPMYDKMVMLNDGKKDHHQCYTLLHPTSGIKFRMSDNHFTPFSKSALEHRNKILDNYNMKCK